MSSSLPPSPDRRHLSRLENVPVVMAKADLKKVEMGRAQIGRVVLRCFALAGLSQKEGAALLNRDAGQVQRWIVGSERVQLDAVFAVEQLRQPFVQALGELAGADVQVIITIRRSA